MPVASEHPSVPRLRAFASALERMITPLGPRIHDYVTELGGAPTFVCLMLACESDPPKPGARRFCERIGGALDHVVVERWASEGVFERPTHVSALVLLTLVWLRAAAEAIEEAPSWGQAESRSTPATALAAMAQATLAQLAEDVGEAELAKELDAIVLSDRSEEDARKRARMS
jgi:hypothetical protein